MIEKHLNNYLRGALTEDHLVVNCLLMIDPAQPECVLRELPNEILERMREFSEGYQQEKMVTNYGSLPTNEQVAAARRWIESSLVKLNS